MLITMSNRNQNHKMTKTFSDTAFKAMTHLVFFICFPPALPKDPKSQDVVRGKTMDNITFGSCKSNSNVKDRKTSKNNSQKNRTKNKNYRRDEFFNEIISKPNKISTKEFVAKVETGEDNTQVHDLSTQKSPTIQGMTCMFHLQVLLHALSNFFDPFIIILLVTGATAYQDSFGHRLHFAIFNVFPKDFGHIKHTSLI